MKIFKNKIFTGVICLLLAGVITFVIIPKAVNVRSATTTVVKLKNNIAYGTEITSDMLITEKVGSFGLPNDVITDTSKVIGMCASSKLYSSDSLTPNKLITKDECNKSSSYDVLVTVSLPSAAAGVAGVLKAGDHVDVYQTAAKSDTTPASKVDALSGIMVYDVLNSSVKSLGASENSNGNTAASNNANDRTPAFVVFAATNSQAQMLVTLDHAKTLYLVCNKEES